MVYGCAYYFEADASPFTWKASDFPMPYGFVIPNNIGTYDGTSDPEDHLFVFTQTMSMYNLSEPVWCNLFSCTLRGRARMWFKSLKPLSIQKFDQLAKSFQKTFLHKVVFQKNTTDEIIMMPVKWGETIKEYVERFNYEIFETGHRLDDEFEQLAINTFVKNLRRGWVFEDLKAKPPSTFEELHVRANDMSRKVYTASKKRELNTVLEREERIKKAERADASFGLRCRVWLERACF